MQPQTNLPPIQVEKFLTHFQAMMGPYGLYQHATLRIPLLSEGYCTDDNARAVTMLIALKKQVRSKDLPLIDELLERCWQFIVEAQEKPGKFLNFRSANGDWLPQDQSEDMYARVIRAATAIQTHSENKTALGQAEEML
ncbi:MAG: hypothetical protein HYZ69_00990, partial [Candidatus Colwellbacteria bacterium]|nr:hypothetical protein [Candidatus Colwellbacteria bacterium]